MKLRAPEHVSGLFSHQGQLLEVSEDACVDVSERDAEALLTHGFRPVAHADAAVSIDEMTRDGLVARVMAMTAAALGELSTEDLRVRLRAAAPKEIAPLDESLGAGVVHSIAADPEIELMSRVELFAFLRARGVAAMPPIRNEELRARARDALSRQPESA